VAVETPVSEVAKATEYDAFLSYAHADREVTTAIQKGLHQIGRRVGQLRALRVFRDDTNLAAAPDLWGKITEALDRSRYMIVVLSPQSAASHWVNEEISYWLAHREHANLMLVLAEGHLQWDATDKSFDPAQCDAAPPALTQPGSLPVEPLYIDVSDDKPWDVRSLVFRDKLTSLAAPIHNKPKDQLTGDDLREQGRFRRLRAAAVAGLALLTVVSVVAALVAVKKQHEATARLRDAVVAKLNSEGAAILAGLTPGGDERALQELLAANAIQANGVPILDAQVARFTTEKIVDLGSQARGVAYSPDNKRIATAMTNGMVRQWDSATGKPVGPALTGFKGPVNAVVYTPDGKTLAAAGADGTMRLWNADTFAPLTTNPQHVDLLDTITASPDGSALLTGGAKDSVQLWDPHTGQLMNSRKVFDDNSAFISTVIIDHSGKLFAVSGRNGEILVYDVDPLRPHAPVIEVKNAAGTAPVAIWQFALSPDGHTIAVGARDLQLFNADTGELTRKIRTGDSSVMQVAAVAFSPDGHRVVTGRSDGAVQLWSPDTGQQLGPTLAGHTAGVLGATFSPDGTQIATTGLDGTLRIWSATLGQLMMAPDPGGTVTFSPDGQQIAASGDTFVQQWDIKSAEFSPSLRPAGDGLKHFAFVDGGRIVTAATDGTVQIWNADSGQPVQPPVHVAVPEHPNFAFSHDGRLVAVGDFYHCTVQLWNAATGQISGQPMKLDDCGNLGGLSFSPDGHHLIVGYDDGLRLWNVDTSRLEGKPMADPNFPNVSAVAFSPDGAMVAAGTVDGVIQLWDPVKGIQLPKSPLHGHTGQVIAVAFGQGHQLATAGLDTTVRLWDTSSGQPVAAPLKRPDAVDNVAISPDGRLVESSSGGLVAISPALSDPGQLCDKLPANMSKTQWHDWVSPGIGYITLCPGLPVPP
jgi:WD40 repeat protein